MKKRFKNKPYQNRSRHLHQIPGQVIYVGERDIPLTIEVFDYNPTKFEHKIITNYKEAFSYKDSETVTWINVSGLSHVDEITNLGEHFGLHPLIVEDIVNTRQRPKFEEFDNGLFLVLKMLKYSLEKELLKEHIAIVMGQNFVLSFHESDTRSFDNLKKRIELAGGRIRGKNADYLMYSILDAIVDDYFIVADEISDKAEILEDELFSKNPRQDITEDIQRLKREIMSARKVTQPLREGIKQLENTQHPLIHRKTRNYLRDLSDHAMQVSENIETYREIIWSLMEMYMATVSNRMNEVMKVLTIMASIFIPLTFIGGVYGMNFEYMPELEYHYGYFVVLGIMLLLVLFMLWYFKRKKWL